MSQQTTSTLCMRRQMWLEALSGKDRNSIIRQLTQMGWDAAVFQIINEARGLAPVADEGGVQLNGPVHTLMDKGFFALHMTAVRRLTDSYGLAGQRGVYSLTGLLRDLSDHRLLLTREAMLDAENLAYDYEPIKRKQDAYVAEMVAANQTTFGVPSDLMWELNEQRHQHIDLLSGTTSTARKKDDSVAESVFVNLQKKVDAASGSIVSHATKFIAHAATPDSRAIVNADNIKLTLDDLFRAHEQLCQVAGFVAVYVLGDSCPGFLPAPQFDQMKYIDRPLIQGSEVGRLRELWKKLDREAHRVSQWGLREYGNEFP